MKRDAPPPEPRIFEEPLPEDIPATNLSENARIVLAKRYLKKDAEGTPIEEPEAMFWRVAKVIAQVPTWTTGPRRQPWKSWPASSTIS